MADSADAENPGESVGSICKYVREEVEKRMNGGKAFDQFEPRECARFLSTDSEARISTFKIKVQINALCRIRVTAVVRTPNGEGPQPPSLESATEDGDLF
eukprot:scpid92373/ scgid5382/ 